MRIKVKRLPKPKAGTAIPQQIDEIREKLNSLIERLQKINRNDI